jgi:hypothetical protein
MQTYKEPVFVVGMPRSGTTLIQGILCNTGIYFPMPETHFFEKATYGLPEQNLSKENRESIRRILFKKSRIKIDQEFPDYLTTGKDIFEHLIDHFNPEGRNTFLEKTPRHVFFYSKILEYYPDAKFICMIREPKNVVRSLLKNIPKQDKSIVRLSLLYNKIAAAILKIRNSNNVFLINYEDLTTEAALILKNTCKFLDIPYDSKLIENVGAPPGIVSAHEFWKNKNIEYETIQKNDADKWQQFLSTGQANLINLITAKYAAKFGYNSPYNWKSAGSGFVEDAFKLFAWREFKKIFFKIHG